MIKTKSLFETDTHGMALDVIQTYVMHGKEFELYNSLELFLDHLVENVFEDGSSRVMQDCLTMIMDVLYDLDLQQVSNWDDFLDVIRGEYCDDDYFKIKEVVISRDHRKLPKPASYYTAPKGYCRWCNQPILTENGKLNRRQTWHPECKNLFSVISSPTKIREYVYHRDRGVCSHCGDTDDRLDGSWEADHAVRLRESKGRIEAWMPSNVNTLCKRCHKEKSAKEMKNGNRC